jgi:ribosomal protein S18 acetylase RimI-like enzyme
MDLDPILRRAGPADAAAIAAVTHEAYAKWIPVIGRKPLPMSVDYARAVLDHRFDLAEVAGPLAALIETTPEADALLIVNVAVRPAFQGRGLGVRLLSLAEDLANEAGLAATRLYTHQKFEANVRLYASLGYAVEREERLGDGGVAVHMVKRLARAAG